MNIDLIGGESAMRSALSRVWSRLRPAAEMSDTARDRPARDSSAEHVVLLPSIKAETLRPDLELVRSSLQEIPNTTERLVVVSSTAIYPPLPSHPGMVEESAHRSRPRHEIAAEWAEYEALVTAEVGRRAIPWLMLRAAMTPVRGGTDFLSKYFERRTVFLPWGFDPPWQLLSAEDLATAVGLSFDRLRQADETEIEVAKVFNIAVFNIAPAPIPRNESFRRAGIKPRGLPSSLLRLGRKMRGKASGELDYLCHPFTCSPRLARDELGFEPEGGPPEPQNEVPPKEVPGISEVPPKEVPGISTGSSRDPSQDAKFDAFGMDPAFIQRLGRTAFRVMHDGYWRVEIEGVERVPRQGRAILAGIHRGFFPFDAMMALHGVGQHRGRTPRFLIHPVLLRWPGSAVVITKLGGMVASQENAAHVLESDDLLGIFPEGVRGGFSYYRDAYQVQRFGRDEFVRMALRHQAPIVPFVTVGSAEVFPVLGKVNWRWWRQLSGWPCLPITPTFPILPLPLPTKWHTWFLEPLAVQEHHPPEAAEDRQLVRRISAEVARRMTEAMQQIRQERPSIFWGNVFSEEFRRRSEEWMSSDQRWQEANRPSTRPVSPSPR